MRIGSSTLDALSECKVRVSSRRQKLLAGTAFAGGVFALMLANPQTSYATCNTTQYGTSLAPGAEVIGCATTTTTNTDHNGGTGDGFKTQTFVTSVSQTTGHTTYGLTVVTNVTSTTITTTLPVSSNDTDREYEYNQTIDATVLTGAVIDGYGLAFTNDGHQPTNVENDGTITLTTGTPSAGGSAALNINGSGGSISYTGNGSIDGSTFGDVGLEMSATGAGPISIGSPEAPVVPTFAGSSGIVTIADTGPTGIYLSGGTLTVTSGTGAGINASSTGGAITISWTSGSTGADGIVNSSGGVGSVIGIETSSTTAPTTITEGINMGGGDGDAVNQGIKATTTTGNISIEQTGGTITFATGTGPGFGINANSTSGSITIVTDANSTLSGSGTGSIGINANTGGAATVTVGGTIDPTDIGMSVTGTPATASLTSSGSVTANDIGLQVNSTGSGAVTVTTDNGSVINQGTNGGVQNGNVAGNLGGIVTSAVNGNTSITVNGSISANAFGIAAVATGTGAIGITTGAGNISSVTSSAIGATSAGGAISVTTGTGLVSGVGGIALDATNAGAATGGNITVNVGTGGVTGTAGDGISTTANTGFTTINTAAGSTVSGAGAGSNGIAASATTGAVNINAQGIVTGVADGVVVSASGASAINVSTGSGANSVTGALGISLTTGAGGTITLNGGTGTITGSAGDGIFTGATTGFTSITTAGTVTGSTNGIIAQATTGPITIVADGAVTGSTTSGIGTVSAGPVTISTGAGLVTGTTVGIGVVEGGSGTVAISVGSGGVTATTGDGIGVGGGLGTNSGNVSIVSAGNISGVTNGINTTTSSGNTLVDTHDVTVSASAGNGINVAATTTGNISISAGTTTGTGGAGILATTATGSINLTTTGATSGTGSDGISATVTGAPATGGGVSVITGSTVTGSTSGIVATSNSTDVTSTVYVNSKAAPVTGTAAGGITATSSAGLVSVTTAAVTGSVAGIGATSTTGNVIVATSGNISATGIGGVGIIAGGGTSGSVNVSTSSTSNVSGAGGINASTTGAGAVTITTDGSVTATTGDAIDVTTAAGNVTIQTFGAVTGGSGGDGIQVTSTTGNISVTNFASATVSGDPGVIMTSGGNITEDAATNITGTLNGIQTVETAGGITSITVQPNITVTGVGSGNAGIAASTVTGPIGIVNFGTVTNATGIGVSLTQTGAGSAVLTNEAGGLITGLGTALNPVINIASTTGPTTINNLSGGIGGVGGTIESVSGASNSVAVESAGGPVTINNASLLVGDLLLSGAGSSTVNNGTCSNGVCTPGTWSVYGTNTFANGGDTVTNSIGSTISILNPGPSTFTFGTGTNTLTNGGIVNSNGVVSFLALENINNLLTNQSPNSGIFNVGSSLGALGEQTNFSTGATNTTAGGVQTVTNTGTFNIMALQAQTGAYRGSLNFVGGGGSTFSNAGGTINMQLDNGAPNNAVTLNLTSMGGTSDLNYTYVFTNPALTSAASGFNFVGDTSAQQPPSRLLVDTQIGAPGSTSDRLVIGGNATGVTGISVNDVDGGPGAYNPTGITLVKVEGTAATGSSPTAFNLAGVTSPNSTDVYVQPNSTYPLGAIEKGPWIYPLIYNTHNDPAFMLVGLPGPFLVQTTAFPTAALNIFDATAATWYDQQESTRNCMRHGFAAAGLAYGGGADLAVKGEAPELPACRPGVWTKLIGSWTNQGGDINLGQLGALFNGIQYNTGFHQGTGGALVGVDYAKAELLSREDSLVLSLMGGYINSTASFDAPNAFATGTPFPAQTTSLSFSGGTIAGSATYMNRGFFADALIKADFLTMDVGNIPSVVTPTGSAAAYSNTWGAAGDIGYRFERGRYFAEPIVSLEWAQNRLGNIALPAAATTVMFPNNDMFNVGGGARFGGTLMDDRVHYLEASIIGRVWDRAFENNTVNIANLGPTLTLNQNYAGAYGETGLQLDWLNRYSGWSAYLRADAKFSDQFQTYGGTAGLHYGF